MKLFSAWLLLIATTLQWVGGPVYLKVIYAIQVESRMSPAEKTVSQSIKANTGIEANINLLDPSEVDVRDIGYSNFFLFSEEVENETVYYTVNAYPIDWVECEYTPGQHLPESGKNKMASFERFFSHFIINTFHYPKFSNAPAASSGDFATVQWSDLLYTSLLVPPPERV